MQFVFDRSQPTPSKLDGLAEKLEVALRIYGAELIQQVGILLKVPQVTVATGSILFHRFYFRKSFRKFDVKYISIACLYLACKIEETQRSWRDVVNVMHFVFLKRENRTYIPLDKASFKKGDYNYWDLKNALVVSERQVLKELGFLVYVEHSHKFILNYLKVLDGSQELAQNAWNYVNDSLRTTVCVHYKPEAIAVTAIYIAARQLAIALPESPDAWWELFDVTMTEIEEIGRCLLTLYKLPKALYIDVSDAPKN